MKSSPEELLDTCGNIYIAKKQLGLFGLRYTDPGEPAPTAE